MFSLHPAANSDKVKQMTDVTFDDLEDDTFFVSGLRAPQTAVAALGGPKRVYEDKCTKCNGTGVWSSFSGYSRGQCFGCKGKGVLTFSTDAETRRKSRETAAKRRDVEAEKIAAKVEAWGVEHPAEFAWLNAEAARFEFAGSMLEALTKYGHLTERQMATVARLTVAAAGRKAARAIERAQAAEAAPALTVPAIEASFTKAKAAGIKFPKLRLDTFVFSPASATSNNAGAVYVKEGDTYLGKVLGGRFLKVRDCTEEQAGRIVAAATNPEAAAIAYGKQFGKCSVCARELSDPESVARGIGPICAEKYFG